MNRFYATILLRKAIIVVQYTQVWIYCTQCLANSQRWYGHNASSKIKRSAKITQPWKVGHTDPAPCTCTINSAYYYTYCQISIYQRSTDRIKILTATEFIEIVSIKLPSVQFLPLQPVTQLQKYDPGVLKHSLPWAHGKSRHSLRSIEQRLYIYYNTVTEVRSRSVETFTAVGTGKIKALVTLYRTKIIHIL